MYDVYISCSYIGQNDAKQLCQKLKNKGLSVFLPEKGIQEYSDFIDETITAINESKVFIAIVDEHSVRTQSITLDEIAIARQRGKTIIPVIKKEVIEKDKFQLPLLLSRYQYFLFSDNEDFDRLAENVLFYFEKTEKKNSLSEKVSEYLQAGAKEKATEALCDIINENIRDIKEIPNDKNGTSRFLFYRQIILYMQKLVEIYDFDYSDNGKKLALRKLEAINSVGAFTDECAQFEDILTNAFAIMSIYFDREIRTACADSISYGDVNSVSNYYGVKYEDRQMPFVKRFESVDLLKLDFSEYTDDMTAFIKEAYSYIYKEKTEHKSYDKKTDSSEDERLKAIASFIHEGNRLFYAIGDSNYADEFLRCLLLSYERLKNYCIVIGETKICAECIDRIFEIKKRLKKKQNGNSLQKADEGIKTLLGLTIPRSGKFDVFLCHKNEDYDIAEQMYYFFHSNLIEAFLDKKSLSQMAESQYRTSIMEALDKTTHFIVIISNLEYLKSQWVSLEMEIFQNEIDEGRKTGANFIIVVTNDVYDEIIKSNKTVLPISYRRCEIIKVEEYRSKILSYIK